MNSWPRPRRPRSRFPVPDHGRDLRRHPGTRSRHAVRRHTLPLDLIHCPFQGTLLLGVSLTQFLFLLYHGHTSAQRRPDLLFAILLLLFRLHGQATAKHRPDILLAILLSLLLHLIDRLASLHCHNGALSHTASQAHDSPFQIRHYVHAQHLAQRHLPKNQHISITW